MIAPPKIWFGVSLATVIVSIVVIVAIGPVWGIDFVGGSLLQIQSRTESIQAVREHLDDNFSLPSSVQPTGEGALIIRTRALSPEEHEEVLTSLQEAGRAGEEERFESIGPTIGETLRRKAWIAVLLTVAVMILYLAYTFRAAKKLVAPWKFGVAAAWALLHDLLLVTAMFVIFGEIWDIPIDALFVTAQLAILGYSVNDTIVLFNRLRTESNRSHDHNLPRVIDKATRSTLVRSLNTSFTTLLVLIALLVFGGATLKWFIVALALGTITGTYSSIFVAPPMLYALARRKNT